MSWTKRQFVEQAFEEIGYASYVFDLEPEQLQAALRRLDSMMATWNGKGIRIGYPMPSSPENSDLDAETEVPDAANEAIYTNLALRIAPTVGKTPTNETKAAARLGYKVLLNKAAVPQRMRFPSTLPVGSGNKPWRYYDQFTNDQDDSLTAGDDGPIEFT